MVDLFFDFYLVHKLFNTVVSTARLGQFTPKKSRDKNSRKKKGLKTVGKKIVKTVTKKKGM